MMLRTNTLPRLSPTHVWRCLQDSVPAFDHATALAILQQELGQPVDKLFSHIPPQPVAAASLGQVYRCRLAGSEQEVAVKVQRPGLARAIALDLLVLRLLLGAVRSAGGVKQDVRLLADELARGLLQELDNRQEVAHAQRFAQVHSALSYVAVPRTLEQLSSSRVLVTEWVQGYTAAQLLAVCEAKQQAQGRPEARAAASGAGSSDTGTSDTSSLTPEQARQQLL
jgi:predicted unusual protein kinase regulating ubiquinone biosynthesis (AarF/ABC1/UbiB family)